MFALARSVGLLAVATCPAFGQAIDPQAARWEAYASCAAAYQANWQNRLSDPSRAPSMAAMIKDESEQYRLAAAGYYEKDKRASKADATRTVDQHVKANVQRFIAMDKVGTLEAFIDKCPQVEEPN